MRKKEGLNPADFARESSSELTETQDNIQTAEPGESLVCDTCDAFDVAKLINGKCPVCHEARAD